MKDTKSIIPIEQLLELVSSDSRENIILAKGLMILNEAFYTTNERHGFWVRYYSWLLCESKYN